jgi:NADH dehydrogenase/NADH:ubiquinone oxidoreductase subunit G
MEEVMEKNNGVRTPVSQQPYEIKTPLEKDLVGGKVTVEINEKRITIPFGTTILEACKMNQIHIPTLCNHPDLRLAGVCRICVVDVEGMKTLQTACSFPITSPIKIHTSTPMVRKARRHIIDLLLSEHYGDCYTCVKNGKCLLQHLAKEYGVDGFTFGHISEPRYEIDNSSGSRGT